MKLASEAQARDLRSIDAPSLLGAISKRILRFGGVGTGTAYKLIINMIGAVQIASLAEGVAMAERARLDLEVVAEAIATGQVASPQVGRNSRRMIDNDHDENVVFTPLLRLKDVEYALQLARSLTIVSPFGQLVASQPHQLRDLRHRRGNESRIIEVARLERPED